MVVLIKKVNKALSFLRTHLPARQGQEFIKLKASTLIESLVASVIIIVVFTIASLTLNNVFQSNITNDTDRVQNRINTLEYLFLYDKIKYPYQEDFENWNIQLVKSQNVNFYYVLEAKQVASKKSISRKLRYVKTE